MRDIHTHISIYLYLHISFDYREADVFAFRCGSRVKMKDLLLSIFFFLLHSSCCSYNEGRTTYEFLLVAAGIIIPTATTSHG